MRTCALWSFSNKGEIPDASKICLTLPKVGNVVYPPTSNGSVCSKSPCERPYKTTPQPVSKKDFGRHIQLTDDDSFDILRLPLSPFLHLVSVDFNALSGHSLDPERAFP